MKKRILYLKEKIKETEAKLQSLHAAFAAWVLDDRDDAVIQYNWKKNEYEIDEYSSISYFRQLPTWDAVVQEFKLLESELEENREELAALLPKKKKAANKISAEIRFKS